MSASDVASASDAELARRIASGRDAQAEAELCQRFSLRVRLYGRRHLRDAHAAADLVQRVLVLALEKLRRGELDQPERVASFMLGIARNAALDLRRAEHRHEGDPDAARELPAAMHEGPEPAELERLRHCLAGLSERERTVIVLTYYGDCSSARIAEQLGASETNVRVIRHRAIAQLSRCMEARP